jgi:hypothetical protein
MPCLLRRDVHADEVFNKYINPLDCPLSIQTGLNLLSAARSIQTNSDRFKLQALYLAYCEPEYRLACAQPIMGQPNKEYDAFRFYLHIAG